MLFRLQLVRIDDEIVSYLMRYGLGIDVHKVGMVWMLHVSGAYVGVGGVLLCGAMILVGSYECALATYRVVSFSIDILVALTSFFC